MIQYTIISRRTTSPSTSRRNKSERQQIHKHEIYERIVKKWMRQFPPGKKVKIRGTKLTGVITALYLEKEVIWEGLNPHWIEVQLMDGTTKVCTARQLTT